MMRSPFTIALAGLALSACSQTDPQQTTSAALTEGVLVPAYSSWVETNRQLASSGAAFCADQQDLATARQAFLGAQSAWAGLQPMLVGPMGEGNLSWQVQFWPDKKNLVARQVTALLNKTPQVTPAILDKSSVVVQGLTAYEYVLYDTSIDLNDPEQKARYCPLLTAIGDHQQALSTQVLEQWQAEDGISAQLKTFPNERYAEPAEAIAELLRTQVTAIDGLKKKLGTPMGRQSKGTPQPYQAEAWRSNASMSNVSATLAGAEKIWHGANNDGIQALLGDDNKALKDKIDAAYAETRAQLATLQRPLSEMLKDEQGRKSLNDFYETLNILHRLHEGELARTLGIQLGFNANDGD